MKTIVPRILRICSCVLISLLSIHGLAQNAEVVIAFDSVSYGGEAMWSSDSLSFVFYEPNSTANYSYDPQVNLPVESWVKLDTVTKSTSYHARWPLQPELTPTDLQLIQPLIGEAGEESLMFESADGNYILCVCFGTTLFSRTQQDFVTFNVALSGAFHGPDRVSVLWSLNGEAFVLANVNDSDFPSYYYITNYSTEVKDATLVDVEPIINDRQYKVYPLDTTILRDKVYDLSNDGKAALFLGRYASEGNFDIYSWPVYLVVWNTLEPDASYILEDVKPDTIMSASFVGDSKTELLLVNDDGLVHYDLTNNVYSVIDPTLTASEAYFSPDSRYLAVVCCFSSPADIKVTILDLLPMVEHEGILPSPRSEKG